ncbi:hypothetical protein OSB04_025260 [Centaurea solstitialis]|uniref:Uncharacterized protein n=1 Tax=Centaurea solstitialis TaxID=347529 RepID=A0AA38SVB8_9ASTR|nr:hypothetical protein OSB04_025260 [Centaurea solstitialis]
MTESITRFEDLWEKVYCNPCESSFTDDYLTHISTDVHLENVSLAETKGRDEDLVLFYPQVVGEMTSVKNATEKSSSLLRESQHRDLSNNTARRPSMEGPPNYGSRVPGGDNAQPLYAEDLVFRILCPNDKVDMVVGKSDAFMEMLWVIIGVQVKLADLAVGSDEKILIISSDEGPHDKLLAPAQKALLHIQTRILGRVPKKEDLITTRLLLSSGEKDGFLAETKQMTGADIRFLPRENFPQFASANEEVLQVCCLCQTITLATELLYSIVGGFVAARTALVEVTFRLRSCHRFQGFFPKDAQPPAPAKEHTTS